jgi:hypothetical protein
MCLSTHVNHTHYLQVYYDSYYFYIGNNGMLQRQEVPYCGMIGSGEGDEL